ncbi:sensor domain-containing diguanylate cyclase [Exiguobacterium sp. s131]|uniref:sensor domain-containing diguanylate cyclase n=1 Tax=Exiguobacterium sp. s131 TaxID=2751278 RepID=UPI001BEC180D|nr:sensor domain-containing diguanylate cyclase [Exiguobacterium sp. s131]
MHSYEFQMYRNFDELAIDLIELAKEIVPDKLVYLTSIENDTQHILKLSSQDSPILLEEGMSFDLKDTVCNRIDFNQREVLMYEDIESQIESTRLQSLLREVNIKSYLGIPILTKNGDIFGTLCVANHKSAQYDSKSVRLLKRVVRMFSYYLELERRASRDELTDLYNRHYLSNYFETNPNQGGALFLIDLDGFKWVNDTFGHDEGDLVLKEVALRLRRLREPIPDSRVYRLGGDEFLIKIAHALSKETVIGYAEQILYVLKEWDDHLPLSASIGIAQYDSDEQADLGRLLKEADIALYQSKSSGKNTYKFYK